MKVLKGFFLVIIIFIMFFVLASLEIQFAMQRTVLSSDYFEKMYEANDMEDELAQLIETQMQDFSQNLVTDMEGQEIEITIDPGKYIDAEWISEEISEILKQTYAYFMGSEDDLPAVDLEPIKEMILEMATDQMLALGNVAESIESLDSIIAAYNEVAKVIGEELDEAAIDRLAAENEDKGFSAEILKIIILTGKNLDESLSSDEKAEIIAREIIGQQMGLDEMDNELDLNDVMEEAYPEGENPLEAVRAIINAVRNTLFYALLIIFLLFVLVVVFTSFKPAPIFGWLSGPLIAGGLFGIGIWILGRLLPALGGFAEAFQSETFAGAENVMAFAEGYLRGIFNFILVQGLILLAAGIVFAIIAGVVSANTKKSAGETQSANAGLIAVRVIVVIVLLASVVFTASRYYLRIYDEIDEAVEVLKNTQANEKIVDAIAESIDFPLGDFMGGDE